MKKLIVILFAFVSLSAFSQTTIGVIFQPCDLGLGVRLDQQFKDAGLYASLSKGEYRFDGGYIKDHVKMSLGLVFYKDDSFFTLAVNQHTYGEHEGKPPKGTLDSYSFELGAGVRVNKVAVSISFDPIKGEGTAGVGFVIR